MSETPVKPDVSGTPEPQPVPQYSKADIDAAAAAARRESEAKLAENQKRLDALEAKEKERVEAEMSEIEKLQAKIGEYETQFKSAVEERDDYKSKIDAINDRLKEKVEKEVEGLTDDQKSIIDALPLERRLDAISQFKAVDPKSGNWGKGNITGAMSYEKVEEIKAKFGPASAEFRQAYEAYKKASA